MIQETLEQPSIVLAVNQIMFLQIEMECWMGPFIRYLESGDLLID